MVSPSKFAHVVYSTHRFDEMVAWYLDVFEAEVQHSDGTLAFLTYDDEHHRFAILNLGDVDDPPAKPGGVGVNHVAYTWDDLEGLLDTYERLRDQGIEPIVKIRHGMTLSMYYADPDGNQSEFQVDLLEVDEANAFMASDAFAANPIGERFDPDELVRAHRAGEDLRSLVWRSDQDQTVALPGARS